MIITVHGWLSMSAFSKETGSISSDNLWMSCLKWFNLSFSQSSLSSFTWTKRETKPVTFKTLEELCSSWQWMQAFPTSSPLSICSTSKDPSLSGKGSVTLTKHRPTSGEGPQQFYLLKSLLPCYSWPFATLLSTFITPLRLGFWLQLQFKG